MNDMTPLQRLDHLCECVERGSTVYRPPDFQMLPTYADIRRRRELVTTFGMALGVGTMLGVIVAVIFLP